MKVSGFLTLLFLVFSVGCAEVMNVIQSASVAPLTEEEVVSGLREALTLGARASAEKLSLENGYYGDPAVRIPLPDEAKIIVDNISKIPGGQQLVEDVILRINRAAEDAAKEAAAVFVNSITQMTVSDGFNILRGPDNAATSYLRATTYDQLFSMYKPRITSSTEKKIVGNISTKESWMTLTGKWNSVANSVAGRVAGLKPVNTNLDDFLTARALDGLFSKVEIEELKIRKDISARVTPLLKKVFGSLDAR